MRLSGTVVHGDGRGHGLGFPTANLQVPHIDCADGIYAAWARIAGEPHWREATVSIGKNPTFDDVTETRVECHLHDFSGDLYGAHATVVLVSLIRDMQPFEHVAGLIQRTAEDLIVSRRLLATAALPDIGSSIEAPADHDH